MLQTPFKPAYILSVIIAILASVASVGGLFTDLYRDNPPVISAFRGNDLVTLFVAVPLLVAALILAQHGSPRAQLIWLGSLGYMLYNYIFYLYGAAFNQFFLLYIALFTLSVYALIFGLSKVNVNGISQKFRAETPVKSISSWMLFFAVLLGGLWIARSLSFVITGQVPEDVVKMGHPTALVYATDLSLLIPGLVLGAIWLWQRRAWGYVLAAIVLVKATTYGLALLTMTVYSAMTTGVWDALTPLWIFLTAGCLISARFLLGNMQPHSMVAESEVPSYDLVH